MTLTVITTYIPDVVILEPKAFGDSRGWFMETWSKRDMEQAGLFYDFVQDNQSYSAGKGTLRGLHFQKGAASQAKLVRCVKGRVLDVAVDLRAGSPTFRKWVSVELSAENKRQLLVPRGFAHGYLTLTDEAEFIYRVDHYYAPEMERSIIWNDPDIGVEWGIDNPILAEKDKNAPLLKDGDVDFIYMKQ